MKYFLNSKIKNKKESNIMSRKISFDFKSARKFSSVSTVDDDTISVRTDSTRASSTQAFDAAFNLFKPKENPESQQQQPKQ